MDGEAVPNGPGTGVEKIGLVQHALDAAAVKDGGVVDQVAIAEVEVGSLVAVETAVNPVGSRDGKGIDGIGVITVIGAPLNPYLGVAVVGEIGGIFQLRSGISPRGAIAFAVGADVDDAVFIGMDVHRDDVHHRSLLLIEAIDVVNRVVVVA